MNKREISYNFAKEIYKSLFKEDENAKFTSKDVGPGNSIVNFVDLVNKNYMEEYYNSEYDTEDLFFEATYQTGKVLYYPEDKIEKLYKIYKLTKINKNFPILGKVLRKVINPILRKFNYVRIYAYEHL